MRNLILTVLLATSAAMPAMAQDRDGRERDRGVREASSEQRDEARAARRAERAQRNDNPRPAERAQRAEGERAQVAVQQPAAEPQVARRRAPEPQGSERRYRGQRRSNDDGMTAAIERQQAAAAALARRGPVEGRRDYRRDGSQLGRENEPRRVRDGQVVVQRDNVVRRDRNGRAQPGTGSHRRWTNHWRGDRNYDWRNHRNRHRSVYRLGNYWDPYGSHYRRFSIGFSLFPSYYQSNYWLDDPWQYRLPPAYGPYRWVRYYNDALLVNIYTGQVVDVVHSFFW